MPCCGNARPAKLASTLPYAELVNAGKLQPAGTLFQYTGKTKLVVIGGITRRLYRFDEPAARAIVDHRDVPSLSAIPMLRRL